MHAFYLHAKTYFTRWLMTCGADMLRVFPPLIYFTQRFLRLFFFFLAL